MKWIIFISLFCLSFSFIYSFINKSNLDLSNNSESFYEYSSVTIDGKEFKMSNLKGKKVIIVNVASKCGYTPQYEGLQKLYMQYKDKVEILGFPSNDFLWQEPGKNSDIKSFCTTKYGVTFPMFEKVKVKKGKNQDPLYTWLSHLELNGINNQAPSWNFCKYLINEKGELENFYSSSIKPLSEEILNFINNE